MIYDLQKASILKRASAFLLDIILLAVLAAGFMFAAAEITGYDDLARRMADKYTYYEELHPIPEDASEEERQQIEQQKDEEMKKDKEAVWLLEMILSLTVTITSIGIFLSYAVLEFVVPLLLKNGMTVGKKIFGIAVVRIDSVAVSPMQLFIRTFVGKFAIETMIPLLIAIMFYFGMATWVMIAVFLLIPIFELILIIATRNNYLIHDALSGTVAVDMASQMIFDSVEQLLEYKKKVAAETASQQLY